MYASSYDFTVVEYIKTSKNLTFLPPLVSFVKEEERGCASSLLSVCFSMIKYNREKSSMKHALSSTEDHSDQYCDLN